MGRHARILVAVGLLAAGYFAGRRLSAPAPGAQTLQERKVLYYTCPMHPQYRSDRPGDAPCCGMRLEPVYAGGAPAPRRDLPQGVIQVSPDRQQLIGVRFEPAGSTPGVQIIRAFGKVVSLQDKMIGVTADVPEIDAPNVRVGQSALVSQPYPPKKSFWARVDYIFERLDGTTRSLKIRLSAPLPSFPVVAETYWNVDIRLEGAPALTVPALAVLDSGTRKTVFVDLGDGYIEPRRVETGRTFADRVEVVRGLKKGERVAVSGTFLLDSEAQMKAGLSPAEESVPRPPVHLSKMEAPQAPAGAAPAPEPEEMHVDPICGMKVKPTSQRRRTTEFHEHRFYFCSEACWRQFVMNPELYGQKALAASKGGEAAPAAVQPAPPAHPHD